jgi:peroxiredoxin
VSPLGDLRRRPVPALSVASTDGGTVDLAAAAAGTLVLYCYPSTARPGEEPPAGWDEIPGARGCTPQACAFRDHHAEIAATGALVHGLSVQTPDEQREAAERLGLPYALLSDPVLALAEALGLPTFETDGRRFYARLTLIARDGVVDAVLYPVPEPARNAADVLALLRDASSAAPAPYEKST